MEVGLMEPRGHCVRWGPSPLPKKGASAQATLCSIETQLPPEKKSHPPPPTFWPMSIVAKRLDGRSTDVDLGPGYIVLDWVPAPRERGTAAPSSFRPMSIVVTVANLSYC